MRQVVRRSGGTAVLLVPPTQASVPTFTVAPDVATASAAVFAQCASLGSLDVDACSSVIIPARSRPGQVLLGSSALVVCFDGTPLLCELNTPSAVAVFVPDGGEPVVLATFDLQPGCGETFTCVGGETCNSSAVLALSPTIVPLPTTAPGVVQVRVLTPDLTGIVHLICFSNFTVGFEA
jgi:hypothetical protein